MLANVDCLSDDESKLPAPVIARAGQKRKRGDALVECDLRSDLRQLVASHCRCYATGRATTKRNCFIPFREASNFKVVLDIRRHLKSMHKSDSDRLVACQRYV